MSAKFGLPKRSVLRRPQIDPEFVLEHRRRRFARAAAEIGEEFGLQNVTVTLLCQLEHAARNTFYDSFTGVDDCLRWAVADFSPTLFDPFVAAQDNEDWLDALATALRRFYAAVAAEPALAKLVLLHSLAIEPESGGATLENGVEKIEALLARGRAAAAASGLASPANVTEEGFARAICSLAALRLYQDDVDALEGESKGIALLAAGSILGGDHAAAALASVPHGSGGGRSERP